MPAGVNRQNVQRSVVAVNRRTDTIFVQRMLRSFGIFPELLSFVDAFLFREYNSFICKNEERKMKIEEKIEKLEQESVESIHKMHDRRKESENETQKVYYANQPKIGNKKGTSKLRQHMNRGLTSFLVIAAGIMFYFLLLRFPNLSNGVSKVIEVLKPVIVGFVIAFLLNPLVKRIDRILTPELEKSVKKPENASKIARGIGIFISEILLILLIIGLCNMLIPELYSSIRNLVFTLPRQLNDWVAKIDELVSGDSTVSRIFKEVLAQGTDMFQNWLKTGLLTKTNELMNNLTEGVTVIIGTIMDFLIGMIISVYLLFGKETFVRQIKKSVYALFPARYANLVLHFSTKTNEIFGGFIIGKIIDSAIIGALCFLGLNFLNMPYVALVSVVVGVTNVIPFFGPYIGAVPSAILIMLEDPMKGVYFIIFIIILQQFDGNILGPKILGDSTGLSAFWVIVAILLGGGLFGFVGMIMGVPTFAVIYYMVGMFMDGHLEKKKLPVDSSFYDEMSYVDDDGVYVHSETKETEQKDKPAENVSKEENIK